MSKKDQKLEKVLQEIGLGDNEAQVYFASLSLGPSTVLAISRASRVKRTTVYSVIESLKMKGLMAEELKGFKTIYVASAPEKLREVLDKRKNILDEHFDELKTLYNLNDQEGTIRYYEGLESVKSVYDGVLDDMRSGGYYLVVGDIKRWNDLDPKFFGKFVEKRSKMNVDMRLLSTDSEDARRSKQFEKNFNQKVKILPEGTSLSTSLIVTPQKVVIHQYNLPISAIVIQTKSAIQLQKEMFEIMWSAIKE